MREVVLSAIINESFKKPTFVLQQIVNGLSNGAIYSLMAIATVIIYKTTSHLNFAQGEMACLSTFAVFALTASGASTNSKGVFASWGVWFALFLIILISMGLGAGTERFLVRPVEKRSALAPVIVTLGLFFIINAFDAIVWGTDQRSPVPSTFPSGISDRFTLLEGPPKFFVTYKVIGIWATVGVILLLLTLMLQKTKLGLGYRAVSANRESAELVGIPVGRMLMFGWALAGGIGAIAGVMTAQYLGHLDFNLMAGVLLYGFAAACLGGFDSLKGAVVGGIIVGLAEALLPSAFTFIGTELGLAMALFVILVVLFFRPQGLFGSKRVERV
jgi:branched-chain amino acid transport system permease protein